MFCWLSAWAIRLNNCDLMSTSLCGEEIWTWKYEMKPARFVRASSLISTPKIMLRCSRLLLLYAIRCFNDDVLFSKWSSRLLGIQVWNVSSSCVRYLFLRLTACISAVRVSYMKFSCRFRQVDPLLGILLCHSETTVDAWYQGNTIPLGIVLPAIQESWGDVDTTQTGLVLPIMWSEFPTFFRRVYNQLWYSIPSNIVPQKWRLFYVQALDRQNLHRLASMSTHHFRHMPGWLWSGVNILAQTPSSRHVSDKSTWGMAISLNKCVWAFVSKGCSRAWSKNSVGWQPKGSKTSKLLILNQLRKVCNKRKAVGKTFI